MTSPFGTVKRKITNTPMDQEPQDLPRPGKVLTNVRPRLYRLQLPSTIQNLLLKLQNVTVSFTTTQANLKVCMANTWWQVEQTAEPDQSLAHLHEPAVVFCLQLGVMSGITFILIREKSCGAQSLSTFGKVYSVRHAAILGSEFSSGRHTSAYFRCCGRRVSFLMRSLQQTTR
jgi:hypothetical protein